jgi:predicted  nucleic acid-binding Zn-ribbon protein
MQMMSQASAGMQMQQMTMQKVPKKGRTRKGKRKGRSRFPCPECGERMFRYRPGDDDTCDECGTRKPKFICEECDY